MSLLADPPHSADVLELFHPAVRLWFERRFADGPTEAQLGGWPAIAAGKHTLICAPTGSGKTLAGFLAAIDALYREHEAGESTDGVTRVVYLSPLKALAVDIHTNLEQPLQEIATAAHELGYDPAPITVGVRTGDSTSAQRQTMLRRPPNLLVTTPESLYLYLTAERSRGTLKTVDTVIVDEIHALARDKRGSHLTLSLERLAAVTERPPVRIGLSATVKPVETAARLLVGVNEPMPEIVDSGHRRALKVSLELPDAELEAAMPSEQLGEVLDLIAAHVAEHRTTLVFVNTRMLSERVAHELGERLGGDQVAAHTARCRASAASGSSDACGQTSSARWWRPRHSSSASMWAPSSWCARSARRTVSPPSYSALDGPTTSATAFHGASCTPPPATSWWSVQP